MLKKLSLLEKYEQQAAQRAHIQKVEAEQAAQALESPSTGAERIARALREQKAQNSLESALPNVKEFYVRRRKQRENSHE